MYSNRLEAGEKLAEKLKENLTPIESEAVILAIPRGGLLVGQSIRRALSLPLDCLIVKKIPAPEEKELAIGAVGEGGVVVWDEGLVDRLEVSQEYKQKIVKEKVEELEKKYRDFRGEREIPRIKGKTVIIVDDGVATGATIKAAVSVVRNFSPKEVVVAVPVIALEALPQIKSIADKVIFLEAPEMFFSVGQFYEDFRQISDEEAREILGDRG